MMRTTFAVLLLSAATVWAAEKPKAPARPSAPRKDLLTGVVDPYDPVSQRTLFFQAAGPDSEMSSKEFAANRGKASSGRAARAAAVTFAQRFDRWDHMMRFDRDNNHTLGWFEADAYRRDLRRRVLAVYDRNRDGRLTGQERVLALKMLMAGKVPSAPRDPRLATPRPVPPRPTMPGPATPSGPAVSEEHLRTMPAGEPTEAERRAMEKHFDRDRNGRLDEEEQAALAGEIRRRREEYEADLKLRKRFDLNRDGRVTEEERRQVMETIRQREREEFMRRNDTDGDGKLSEEERMAMRRRRGGAMWGEAVEKWKLRDFDADGDGKLSESEEEEVKAFGKQMGEIGKEMRDSMMDLNRDGKISDEEKQAVAKEWKAATWKMLVKAARYMDADGDGQISQEERQSFTQRAGKAMIEWMDNYGLKFDANKDGRLSREERTALVAGLREEMATRQQKFDADGDGRLNPDEAISMLEAFAGEVGIKPLRDQKAAAGEDGSPPKPEIRLPDRVRQRIEERRRLEEERRRKAGEPPLDDRERPDRPPR